MKKLDKATLARREELAGALRERKETLDAAVEKMNEAIEEHWEDVQEAMDAYNETAAEATQWISEVGQEIEDHIDSMSEKWQEGDKGQQFATWRDAYNADVEEVQLEKPEPLEVDLSDAADELEQLPESPDTA